MTSSKAFLYLVFVFSLHFFTALSTEFTVGGDKGWVVPQAKDDQVYNEWAAKNRFKVNDTLSKYIFILPLLLNFNMLTQKRDIQHFYLVDTVTIVPTFFLCGNSFRVINIF